MTSSRQLNRILNWLRRRGLESGLHRELQYHLDRRVSDLMASGVSERDARKLAEREIGGVQQLQEDVRDVWLSRWLRDFLYDVRFSLRSFRRSPSFTLTTVLSLALGIGATTAIYSLVDQVMLHALPIREPERLVLIDWKGDTLSQNAFGTYNLMSYPICRDLQKQDRIFDGVLCRAASTVNLSTGGEHRPAVIEIVSGNYFSILGVIPALGRLLTEEDDRTAGASPAVVLSYDFWQAELAGTADVLGRTVFINRNPMTVVGVAAREFRGVDVGEIPALWMATSMSAQAIPRFSDRLNRRVRWMQILGRLRPGLTVEQAQVGLLPWFRSMLAEDLRAAGFPRVDEARRKRYLASTLQLTPAPQGHSVLRRRLTQPLWVLFAATGVLLGLACLNVAGLFLARSSARDREIGTRFALGASRGRVGRQLLSDTMLLALAGGILGTALAPLAMQSLIAFLPRDAAPTALTSGIDVRLLLFAFVVSAGAGILSGIAPALQAGRTGFVNALRQRAGSAHASVRLRKVIVTLQVAFTLILVVGAALFVRTLTGLLAKGPGFDTGSLIAFSVDPTRSGYTPAEATRLIQRIHDEIRQAPNTRSSGVARFPLLTGGSWNDPMTIQARDRFTSDREVRLNAITPDFFETLGARMVAGRNFEERDLLPAKQAGKPVAIINEGFARKYFGNDNPLGALICEGSGPDAKPDTEIIGVVADISYRGIREQSEQAYFPLKGDDLLGGAFYVRFQGTPEAAFRAIRTILRNADPALPIASMRTMDEQVRRSLNTERMLAALSTSFGIVALLLSLVGLYGVMSFVVTQRTREIGIRRALGATQLSTGWLVLRDATLMIATGVLIALPCVWMLGRLIESQLYDIKPTDPGTIASAVLVLCVATLGAALIPARRASTVNPTEALRFD